jgi:GNAT superfamily N-acetyltransferase
MTEPIQVEQVPPGLTAALRQRVLRPHQTVAELIAGTAPESIAFAAFSGGSVVGSALLTREPFPDREIDAWRLRGMATAPERQGQGVGGAVLSAAIDYVRTAGGTVLWANARTPAQRFYESHGFQTVGQIWNDPDIGPHIRMWRKV